jgi:hypothetical protein
MFKRLKRVDAALARRLSRSWKQNNVLRGRLDTCRKALEMVRDANASDPHIPPVALGAIEHAILIARYDDQEDEA